MLGVFERFSDQHPFEAVAMVFCLAQDSERICRDVLIALHLERRMAASKSALIEWDDFMHGGLEDVTLVRDFVVRDVPEPKTLRTLLSYANVCLLCQDSNAAARIIRGTSILSRVERFGKGDPPPLRPIANVRVMQL
jgi:hypothetical protein